MTEIIFDDEVPKNAIILEGFQGIGLVGTIAAEYIAEMKDAKIFGYVDVPNLPPIALLSKGLIKNPIRIYHFKEGKQDYLIVVSEFAIPQKLANEIAKSLVEFAKKNKVKEIISLEGLTVQKKPEDSNTYWVSNRIQAFEKTFGKHSKALETGIIIGVSASLLIQAKLKKIPSIVLMAEAHTKFPDGAAAASLIKLLNKTHKLKVDVKILEEKSEEFESKIWSIIKKAKDLKESNKKPGKTYIG